MRGFIVLALLVGACSGAGQPLPELPPFPEEQETRPEPPPGVLWREDVDVTIEAGLGQFLQLVSIEPYAEADRFIGWEVVDLRPPELWGDVDLRPGDVVTAVNGMPLERPVDAHQAFVSLKEADELRVAVLREGRGHELEYRIRPMASASTTAGRSPSATKPTSSAKRPDSPSPSSAKPNPSPSSSSPPDRPKPPNKTK